MTNALPGHSPPEMRDEGTRSRGEDLQCIDRRSTPFGVVGAEPQDVECVDRRSTPFGVVGAEPQDYRRWWRDGKLPSLALPSLGLPAGSTPHVGFLGSVNLVGSQ